MIFISQFYKFISVIYNSDFHKESKNINYISLACWEVSTIKNYESARLFPVAKNNKFIINYFRN